MFSLLIGRHHRKTSLRQLIVCLIATGVLMLGTPRDARAWFMNHDGIYNDQGIWVPGALSVWPTDGYGSHTISVCWEAPTQAQIDRVYPGQGIGAVSQTDAAARMKLARHNIENTWQRASNVVLTGWGPCSYSLYDEYPQLFAQCVDPRCPEVNYCDDPDRNKSKHCTFPESFNLALLPQNGQRIHPERNGLHVEVIDYAGSWFAPYRGENGIVLGRIGLHSDINPPWQEVHEFGHALGWVHEDGRSDFCNSYVADGGDLAYGCGGMPLPQPSESGPGYSPKADGHTVMNYYRSPPHQFYFDLGYFNPVIADMGTILSPMDVSGIQTFYGRPAAGSIRGYRGRELTDPDPYGVQTPSGALVEATLATNRPESLWSAEVFESSLSPLSPRYAPTVVLDLPTSSNGSDTYLDLAWRNGSANQRPFAHLARWRAWGNMCLWAQSSSEGSRIVLDYCISSLGNPASRRYWIEHFHAGNNYQYQLADTNLCAAVPVSTLWVGRGPLELRTCDIGDDLQLFKKNDLGKLVPRQFAGGPWYKCLNVMGDRPQPGNQLGLWDCDINSPSANEQFFITEQLQFLNSEMCMDMLYADFTLDAPWAPSASVGVTGCKGSADAFAWNSTQSWDVYGGGSLTPESRPTLGAGSGRVILGTELTDRMRRDFTIEMWVNPDASQSPYANIIDFNHRANVGMVIQQDGSNTNRYFFGIGNGSTSCGVLQQLQANRWQHLNFVRSGTIVNLYVDGSLAQTAPCFPGEVYYLPNSTVTVAYNANYGRPFAGRYSGVRLWNNAHIPLLSEVGDPDAALTFNGASDGMSLGSALPESMKGDFTIELLVNPAATQQTYADILDFNHRANVGLVIQQNGNSTNQFLFYIGNGSTDSGVIAQLTANRWQSVVFKRQGTQLSLYLDGSLVSQATGFGGNISYLQGSNVTVGYNANYGRYFNGQIKVVRFSPVAKTL
jgi:hypothetical protein